MTILMTAKVAFAAVGGAGAADVAAWGVWWNGGSIQLRALLEAAVAIPHELQQRRVG
jgi:hypothetical protein